MGERGVDSYTVRQKLETEEFLVKVQIVVNGEEVPYFLFKHYSPLTSRASKRCIEMFAQLNQIAGFHHVMPSEYWMITLLPKSELDNLLEIENRTLGLNEALFPSDSSLISKYDAREVRDMVSNGENLCVYFNPFERHFLLPSDSSNVKLQDYITACEIICVAFHMEMLPIISIYPSLEFLYLPEGREYRVTSLNDHVTGEARVDTSTGVLATNPSIYNRWEGNEN